MRRYIKLGAIESAALGSPLCCTVSSVTRLPPQFRTYIALSHLLAAAFAPQSFPVNHITH